MRKIRLVMGLLFTFAAFCPGGASSQEAKPESRLTTLIESMKDPDPAVRQAAARTVGETKDKAAVPALSEVLAGDPDETVRLVALGALEMIADPGAVPAYVKALGDRSEQVRMSAADALSGLWDDKAQVGLLEVLRSDPSPMVRRSAADALGNPGVMGRYRAHKWDCSADTVPALVQAMKEDESPEVRATAASELGKFQGENIADALLASLDKDKSPAVRAAAAESLGSFINPNVTDKLLDVVSFEADEHVLISALKALKFCGDPRLAEPVTRLLRSGNSRVRWQAIDVLEGIMSPASVGPLKRVADDHYEIEGVRTKAREALELIGTK